MKPKEKLHVVAGLISRGQKVFVAQRGPQQSAAGCWELPGGKVEFGESEQAALIRELQEELCATVTVGGLWGQSQVTVGERSIVMRVFHCQLLSEVVLTEHQAQRWIGRAEVEQLHWAPADVPLLEQLKVWLTGGAD